MRSHLREANGGYIETKVLFTHYLNGTLKETHLTEAEFSKEIEPIMRAFNWRVFKLRTSLGRGYTGLEWQQPIKPESQ